MSTHTPVSTLFTYSLAFRINYHVEVANPTDIARYEDAFVEELKSRGPDFKFYQDQ